MAYVLHVLVVVGIYVILAVSLDLLAGHGGLLSLAHAGFYGVGAYASALLVVRLGAPFLLGVVAGMSAAALLSIVVSLSSLRVHDDYFVLATLAFQMILYAIFNNWIDLTGGPLGMPGIPRPVLFGWTVRSQLEFLLLTAALAVCSYGVVGRISTSAFGRVLRAVREDELLARALGKNALRFKVTAFAVSAALAASAGALYASYVSYIDPTTFTIMESILVLAMVLIGGAASPWGPLIGAAFLVILPEALRFIGLPGPVAGNMRQILYGTLLVVVMMVRPRGLVGRYDFGR